jgi:hypothetical protein
LAITASRSSVAFARKSQSLTGRLDASQAMREAADLWARDWSVWHATALAPLAPSRHIPNASPSLFSSSSSLSSLSMRMQSLLFRQSLLRRRPALPGWRSPPKADGTWAVSGRTTASDARDSLCLLVAAGAAAASTSAK